MAKFAAAPCLAECLGARSLHHRKQNSPSTKPGLAIHTLSGAEKDQRRSVADEAFLQCLDRMLQNGLCELIALAIRVFAEAIEVAFDAQLRRSTEVIRKP